MNGLIYHAESLITKALRNFKAPCIACSFGKDSIVLLHILNRRMGLKIPVVFWRESFAPKKYSYANRIIEDWDLRVIDYPPTATAVTKKNGVLEVMNYYSIGQKYMLLPTGVVPIEEGKEFLCGLKDIVEKPKGAFNFPFDLIFMAHKSSDVDPCHGPVPLHADINLVRNTAATAYPLRDWNDEDVWKYIENESIPIHEGRYEKLDGKWQEREDKSLNPDYFSACTSCLDKDHARAVYCPRLNCTVPNVSDQYAMEDFKLNYMGA